jgi:Zn ribbon nucleic-acid-binding protein
MINIPCPKCRANETEEAYNPGETQYRYVCNACGEVWQGADKSIVKWRHKDGRTIEVWPDRKIRAGYPFPDDLWPALYRSGVPNLTDEEWYASPGADWNL